ncbi:hypothetical protein [Aliidiomarina quisquiliarum]|uniref:hypothetical protein n=1 Tax=Aliidiomarina quisquiliarum TaxID=2938947 RepID=UPI00208F892A|nr:hypothetical protein [Aliidiomarina quisquiliarum]MCO4319900.1 hypothetical protein [Aliidiomarina quisquiliarum]
MMTLRVNEHFENEAVTFVVRITEDEAERRLKVLEVKAIRRLRSSMHSPAENVKGLNFQSYLSDEEKEERLKLKLGLHLVRSGLTQ